jgi:nucleoside-diphosphate-sugar epimerase
VEGLGGPHQREADPDAHVRVLVTGTDGYIGTLLPPRLVERGHEVVGVDAGFYKAGWLYNGTKVAAQTWNEDIRRLGAEAFEGVDAMVHMAELSNDPVGQLAPDITGEINHAGSVRLARMAREAGVERFVYTSSCSVYGVASEELVDEQSPLNPQTAYAVCKTLVERDVGALANDGFSPTFLRNATAFGASPRMRFDIVLNNLCGLAWTTGQIRMESDGTPWRPMVHASDICKAIACTLDAPRELVHNEVLNVGDPDSNYQVREIAEVVGSVFDGCEVQLGGVGADSRSYRVCFHKIHDVLPGFACDWNLERGAHELRELFERIDLDEATFRFRAYTRLKQIEYLLRTGQIDEQFYWRAHAVQPV